MAYIVNNSRGQIIAVVQDGTVNITATSQTLVGKNVTPYGEYEVENLVHQLENFANSTPPGNPIEGQLWWDSGNDVIKVYTGTGWKNVNGITVATSAPVIDPSPVVGDLWFNSATNALSIYSSINTGYAWVPVNIVNVASTAPTASVAGEVYYNSNSSQMFIWNGSQWNLVGPENVLGFATTRWVSTTVLDYYSVERAVIQGVVNGVVYAIIASDEFTLYQGYVPGFTTLYPGINMSSSSVLAGRATNADQLTTARTINGVAFDGTTNITIANNGELTAGTYLVGDPYSGAANQTWAVDATFTNTPSKVVARNSNGDFSARTITANLTGNVTGYATNVTGIVAADHGGTGYSSYTEGQILVGNSLGGLNRANITGSGPIEVTSDGNGISISYAGGNGSGNVSYVGITAGTGIGVSGSPITSAGNITITNSGVTKITPGTGVSINSGSGNVVVTNSGVIRAVAGTGIGLNQETGQVTITNSGVTSIVAGTNISINQSNGAVTISSTGGGGGTYSLPAATASTLGGIKVGSGLSVTPGGTLSALASSAVTQIVAGTGLTGGTITSTGTIGIDSTVMTTTGTQTVTGKKAYTGGIVSQTYNFSDAGYSIFYADPTFPGYTESVVQIAVANAFSHQFYRKRFVVEGSADVPPGTTRPAGATITGIDNGNTGGAGIQGWHTSSVPGLGIGTGALTTSGLFTGALFQSNASRTKGPQFVQIRCYSSTSSTPDPVFVVNGQGDVSYDGNITTPASDYAEYFEWTDGNPNADDRVGYTVTLSGNQIQLAQPGDAVLGVVSAMPAIIGDGAELKWKDMYLTDDWGRPITEPYYEMTWTNEKGNKESRASFEDQSDVPDNAVRVDVDPAGNPLVKILINPDYDPSVKYIPRSKRKEWSPIGLLGKLRVRKGQPVGSNWIKLRDITADIEEWLIR